MNTVKAIIRRGSETDLRFTIPYPPSVNHCYRRRRGGGMYLTDEGRGYKTRVEDSVWEILGWRQEQHGLYTREKCVVDLPGDLVVELRLFTPDKRKRDADNLLKLSLDAIAAGLDTDDSRFLPRVMSRELDRENPRIEVRVFQEGGRE